MSISQVRQINKKDQQIVFDSGLVIDISVEKIFEVGMYIDSRKVARIKFSALSSLNNLDISPHYNLDELVIEPEIEEHSAALCKASVSLFKAYTNGRVRIPRDLAISHLKSGSSL
jgi:hypothetical protein